VSFAGIGPAFSVPLEIQVALVNEINAMKPSGAAPTHMWVNMPYLALMPNDPDYSTASDWPANAYNVIMNGANGYPGLCSQCRLYIENSNETWNLGPAYVSSQYYARQGRLRWNVAGTDTSSFSTLRALWVWQDITTNASAYNANAGRTRFVLGYFGVFGMVGPNVTRAYGNGPNNGVLINDRANPLYTGTLITGGTISGSKLTVTTLTGPLGVNYALAGPGVSPGCVITAIVSGGYTVSATSNASAIAPPINCAAVNNVKMTAAPAPMSVFDHFAGAPYIEADSSAKTAVNSTYGPDLQTACGSTPTAACIAASPIVQNDISAFVNNLATNASPGGGIAFWKSVDAIVSAAMGQLGKTEINYEGGLDTSVTSFSGGSCGQCGNNFVIAVYQSQQWATAQINYFNTFVSNPNMELPSVFIEVGIGSWRWSYAYPDTYGLVDGVPTEGAGLSPTWRALGTYNQRTPFLLNRDLDPATNDNTPAGLNEAA
jgi:hypothetical protein